MMVFYNNPSFISITVQMYASRLQANCQFATSVSEVRGYPRVLVCINGENTCKSIVFGECQYYFVFANDSDREGYSTDQANIGGTKFLIESSVPGLSESGDCCMCGMICQSHRANA